MRAGAAYEVHAAKKAQEHSSIKSPAAAQSARRGKCVRCLANPALPDFRRIADSGLCAVSHDGRIEQLGLLAQL